MGNRLRPTFANTPHGQRDVIITCPNCQTRYKVAADAIGAAGRQVQCAACTNAWMATPTFPQADEPLADPDPDEDEIAFRADDDTLFSAADEAMLDAGFAREDPALASDGSEPDRDEPQAPPADKKPVDAGRAQRHTAALAKRKMDLNRRLPLARLRRAGRWICAVALVALLALVVGLRTEIVRAVPQLNALYSLAGLGTNVLGLNFTDVKTLRTTRDGNRVLMVTAKISNTTNRVAFVPPVLVSLVSEEGETRYEWSVNPPARNILPGDILGIDTQLTNPPPDIARVRLTFVEGQNRPQDETETEPR